MGEIKLLDPTVANQIAAGEVVTRPAAVVKELLENAVDASSSNVTLSLSQAGQAVISVIDDGSGIARSQVKLAFARHATSKISSSADIFRIHTLGFRGEALASISSVAEVEMKTRTKDSDTGIKVLVRECEIVSSEEVSMSCGTSISVYNLFYNTPARRKFLKSESYEKRLCIDEFEHVALAHPEITFTLQLDNQQPVVYPACSLSERVHMMSKKKIAENLMYVSLNTDILKVEGWVASPSCQLQGTHDMYFFVNGRYMNPRLLCKAVNSAYGKMLSDGKNIPCYLFLQVEPDSIDVNVHPTKAEIKFDNEKEIWDLLRTSVRKTIGSSYEIPELDFDKKINIDIPAYNERWSGASVQPPSSGTLRNYNPFDIHMEETRNVNVDVDAEKYPFIEDLPVGMYIPEQESDTEQYELIDSAGEINLSEIIRLEGKYFAVRNLASLLIINYARAQERIEYERFLSMTGASEKQEANSQRLLIPESIEMSVPEASLLIDNGQYLSSMGFEIGDLGAGMIAVYAVPSSIASSGLSRQILEEIVMELSENSYSDMTPIEKMAHAIARTYSNRKNIPNDTELKAIAESLLRCDAPKYTPVSQLPVFWEISYSDIEKTFKH